MLMRLANVAVAAAGVAFTYLLARDFSGGVRRLGMAAAAIAALVPQGHVVLRGDERRARVRRRDRRRLGRGSVYRHRHGPVGTS